MTPSRRGQERPKRTERQNPSAIDERRIRALAEPLDVLLRSREPYLRLEVRNPVHRTRYLVLFPAYPDREPALCTCTDYARRGFGDCKHIEAAWRWLGTRPAPDEARAEVGAEPDVPAIWQELDRRLAADPPLAERDVRELGGPGRVLFERHATG